MTHNRINRFRQGGYYHRPINVPKSVFADSKQNGTQKAFRRGSDYADTMPNAAYRNYFWKTGNRNAAFFGVGIHMGNMFISAQTAGTGITLQMR